MAKAKAKKKKNPVKAVKKRTPKKLKKASPKTLAAQKPENQLPLEFVEKGRLTDAGKAELKRLEAKASPEELAAVQKKVDATILRQHQDQQQALWDKHHPSPTSKEELKRLDKLGLMEIPVRGSVYTLVGLKEPNKEPAGIQARVEIAKRLLDVGPKLPRYVQHLVDPKRPESSTRAVVEVSQHVEHGDEYRKAMKEKAKNNPKKPSKPVITKGDGKKDGKKKDTDPGAKVAGVSTKSKKNVKPVDVPKGGYSKGNRPATSGELIRSRIMEGKMTDEEIAKEVRKLFEGRNTQISDVRWNRGQMRKHGVDAPDPVGGEPQPKKK